MLWLLALLSAQSGYVDPDVATIPAAYIGRWSINLADCDRPDGDVVQIRARHIDFYERHGVVDLLQLNEATDVPVVHASVRWAESLKFSAGIVRLELERGRLYITEGADPEAPRNPFNAFKRCPAR